MKQKNLLNGFITRSKMPIFDYKCKKCGKESEELVRTHADIIVCECGYVMKKQLPDTFNFKLKGPGWYSDGYSKEKKDD